MIHITLVHQAALGDTVLLIPLLRAIRQRYVRESSQITIITRPNLGQMLTMLGFVDAFASADDQDHSRWFTPPEASTPNSMPPWADCELLLSAVSTGSDAWATNARLAHSQLAARSPDKPRSIIFFNPRPPDDYPAHITQWHLEQLAPLELTPAPAPLPRLNPDGAVVIHPGSGGDDKCWPREKFLSLGQALKRNGITPTFILGEAEQERWGNKIINDLKDQFPWYLHMGLYELAEKLARARLFLGNDSGVTHLAAAMGIPIITLFGPSNAAQWSPVGSSITLLKPPPPHEHDLTTLPEETVLAALLAELRKIE